MHPDVAWILGQVESDLIPSGQNDGIIEAVRYVVELSKSYRNKDPEFVRGIGDVADNVATATTNDARYGRDDGRHAELSYNPDLLIAALDEVRAQGKPLGHSLAVEYARSTYDNSDEAGFAKPDRDNFWEKDDDGQDYIDEETFNLEVETYNEAREYLAGVAFAASSLVLRFQVDPDPSWKPS